jgi:PIN domain nuclease of toxin-antitoxin system
VRILLDTSFVYELAAAATPAPILASPNHQFFVSAVSIWEMRLKWASLHTSGARKSPFDPQLVLAVLEDQPVTHLSLSTTHAATPLTTPIPHKDPFDELLLAQAQAEGLRLLTVDRALTSHPLALTPFDA